MIPVLGKIPGEFEGFVSRETRVVNYTVQNQDSRLYKNNSKVYEWNKSKESSGKSICKKKMSVLYKISSLRNIFE